MNIFKSNNNDTTFIKQLLDVINHNIIRSIVKKYSADYRTQSFDSYSHFFTMMYLQLNDSKTLRCCITELQNDIDIDPKHFFIKINNKMFFMTKLFLDLGYIFVYFLIMEYL